MPFNKDNQPKRVRRKNRRVYMQTTDETGDVLERCAKALAISKTAVFEIAIRRFFVQVAKPIEDVFVSDDTLSHAGKQHEAVRDGLKETFGEHGMEPPTESAGDGPGS